MRITERSILARSLRPSGRSRANPPIQRETTLPTAPTRESRESDIPDSFPVEERDDAVLADFEHRPEPAGGERRSRARSFDDARAPRIRVSAGDEGSHRLPATVPRDPPRWRHRAWRGQRSTLGSRSVMDRPASRCSRSRRDGPFAVGTSLCAMSSRSAGATSCGDCGLGAPGNDEQARPHARPRDPELSEKSASPARRLRPLRPRDGTWPADRADASWPRET